MRRRRYLLWAWMLLAVLAAPTASQAEVGDPTLATDHPIYAGEGAFQEIEDCVAFATRGASGPQQQAIALFRWLLQHQYHLASPQEWNVGHLRPDAAAMRDELIPYDADAARFSYGFGLCGTVHAWNEPYWRAMGCDARRREFPGHVNSEVFYDGGWHAFDTDMAGLVFREDGVVAGYDDIARNPELVRHARPPIPCYPFAWPKDLEVMQRGWREIARQGPDQWWKLYRTGYAAQPGVVHLRRGETFTRWFDRDHYGGLRKRRFWHADATRPGGPFRDWTFVNTGHTSHPADLDRNSVRGNASYCNAEFVYTPPLASDQYREGVVAQSPNVTAGGSPRLSSRDGAPAHVTFRHFAPYVIAGDPVDDKNPMRGPATDGLIVHGQAAGRVEVEISVDAGLTWQPAGTARDAFRLDLTEQVKGRYGWWIRFSFDGTDGLEKVAFVTTCQMNQAMYPRLAAGGTRVTYRAGQRAVVPVRPNFGLTEQELAAVEVRPLRSDNIAFVGHQKLHDLAYKVTNNQPGHIVLKVQAPQPLVEVRAAAKFALRVPTPENIDIRLEISTDEGQTWRTVTQAEIPTDNELSSGWLAGKADVSQASTRTALVKVHVYQDGYATGIYDARLYGLYRTAAPQEVTVTYGWREGQQSRTHREVIAAGTTRHEFTVPTGRQLTDEFVRIAAE